MVLKFNLPEETSGVTVKQAKLSIYTSGGSPGSYITAFRLMQDWVEDEVTWLKASSSTEWETPWDEPIDPIANGDSIPPGGMSTTEDAAKTECVEALQTGWEEFDVTSMIQKFIDGTENYGFIIRANDVNGLTDRKYHSSEYEDDISLRPKLEITYDDGSNPVAGNFELSNTNLIKKIETSSNIIFNISFTNNYEIVISTISGRKIKTFIGNGKDSFVLDKSNLNSACYLLLVKGESESLQTERLMIIK